MNIIDIKNCNIYLGQKKILDNFNLQVSKFAHTAIVGPNGSGKSTFIRMLIKELYPSRFEGENPEITILGSDIWNIFELRQKIAVISPKFSEQLQDCGNITVFEAVASSFVGTYGFYADDKISKEQEKVAQDVIEKLGLKNLALRSILQLSTGQLRKVLIARAMVLKPEILLLDEPTSGLDIYAQDEFLKFLRKVASDTTLILVTHHLEEILPEIKNILLIKEGKIFRFGSKKEILTEENLSELFDTKIELSRSKENIYSMRRI